MQLLDSMPTDDLRVSVDVDLPAWGLVQESPSAGLRASIEAQTLAERNSTASNRVASTTPLSNASIGMP